MSFFLDHNYPLLQKSEERTKLFLKCALERNLELGIFMEYLSPGKISLLQAARGERIYSLRRRESKVLLRT